MRMRRREVGVAFAAAGVLVARALAPRLHARLVARCERMFEQMPDTFPPKRMMRGIEEVRANSARTLALLEAREQAGEAETLPEASSTRQRPTRFGRKEEKELAAVGASISEDDLLDAKGGRNRERRTDHSAG
jgi:hypothetical protein